MLPGIELATYEEFERNEDRYWSLEKHPRIVSQLCEGSKGRQMNGPSSTTSCDLEPVAAASVMNENEGRNPPGKIHLRMKSTCCWYCWKPNDDTQA
jgi:hypothetical protein